VTGGDQSALGGVYKLVAVAEEDGAHNWQARVKLSAQPEKMTNPGLKKVVRLMRNGFLNADIIALPEEDLRPGVKFTGINPNNPSQQHVYAHFDAVESLHVAIFENGKLVYTMPSLNEVRAFAKSRLRIIRLESRRLEHPHLLKVSLTDRYWRYKQGIIEEAIKVEGQ